MKQNRKIALAMMLAVMLLTLGGCAGVEDGTIDYVDGHWVFTEAQTGQSMDMTQMLANPDTFYAAASAMGDEELQRCFDLLTAGQSAALFKSLGEERAMALASRLTQPQVERLLVALQEQDEIQNPNDPAALAAIWPTLTTEEQLMALSGLSSEEYAALWALLDAAAPTPEPEPIQPETTDAPDMIDPAYLAGIWHTLTQQEQSDVLGRLSSAQFVALWSLLDTQGSAASEETAPVSSDDGTDAQQTPEPQTSAPLPPEEYPEAPAETVHDSESAQAHTSEASPSASPDAEQTHIALPADPTALAEVWFTLSPQEQMSAIAALTADQFVSLQDRLFARPKPTPVEEDILFIPSPKPTEKLISAGPKPTPVEEDILFIPSSRPTEKQTPAPTLAPTAMPDETGAGTAEPDLTDPSALASIWHTLSPQEQLSILSMLTVDQYTALQEKLAQLSDSEGDVPNNEEPAVEEKPDKPNKESGDVSTSEEETPAEQPNKPVGTDGDAATPEEETPAEQPDEPGRTDGDAATPEEETPAEQPDEPVGTDGDAATPEEEAPSEKTDESGGTDSDPSAPEEEISKEESEDSAPINLVYLASIWHTLTPSEQLSILSTLSIEQYHALQELLVRQLNGEEGISKDTEQTGETTPAEKQDEPDETNSDASVPKEEIPEENPDESGETTNDIFTPEKKASAEQSAVSAEEVSDLSGMEDGLAQASALLGQLLPNLIPQPDGEVATSDYLPPSG